LPDLFSKDKRGHAHYALIFERNRGAVEIKTLTFNKKKKKKKTNKIKFLLFNSIVLFEKYKK